MAKRNRGSNRPGRRHENRPGRPQPRPAARPSQGLSAEEEARAAELETQFLEREKVAEAARTPARERSRDADLDRSTRARGLLATRAAEEYAYVARDVRRIIRVAALMAAALAAAWVLIDVLHVIKIS
jgi:hypothetical protein